MKKQNFWMIVFCAVMLAFFLGANVCGAAESASQYKTMYGTGGYKNIHDPADWGTPPPSMFILTSGPPGTNLFRYYIPSAANLTITLGIAVPQSQMIGAVARLGFPPQCDMYSTSTGVSESAFYGLPWDAEGGATLTQLRARDCCYRNHTGTISIVDEGNASSQGEWLYVKVLFDGNAASHVAGSSFQVKIDSYAYTTWYNGMGTSDWDSHGDPLPLQSTAPYTGTCNDFNPTGGGDLPPPGGDDPFQPGFPPVDPPPPSGGDYTITVYKDGSGTVTPPGPVTVDSGASQTFTFVPAEGYVIDDVIIDPWGSPQHLGAVTNYTFTNVTENKTISAIFKEEEEEEVPYPASNLWPSYTIPMQCGGHTVEFTPILSFTDPPADVIECYAAYLKNGILYIAKLGLDGKISFERYILGDEVASYGTFNFDGGDLWECMAFQDEDLIDNMLSQTGIVFVVGVCAVGDIDSLQGALFEFECSD